MRSLFGLDPETYRRHLLHGGTRTFAESNCYTDVLIELLHARGDEPLAALGATVRVDFEGDQWTFFKPASEDLAALFGVDVHEMIPYRPLPEQIAEQLDHGRTLLIELDSWYLPDTAGITYRAEHVKTSAAIEAIDPAHDLLRYFHGTALHELGGGDFRGLFRIDGAPAGALPPYTELIRFDAGARLAGPELRGAARRLFAGHLARRPPSNPFQRFAEHLGSDLAVLARADSARYQAYVFGTARMAGAAFEICQAHVEWLYGPDAIPVSRALGRIVTGAKALVFKLARRRPFASGPLMSELCAAWDASMGALDTLAG